MKTNRSFYVALVLLVTLVACDKDDEVDDSPSLPANPHGLWIGSHTVNQLPSMGTKFYSFVIKPDGKMLTEGVGADGNTYYHQGTWTLVGDSLKATYTTINSPIWDVTQHATFYFNKTTRTLTSGTWKDGQGGSNYTGTFPTMVIVD